MSLLGASAISSDCCKPQTELHTKWNSTTWVFALYDLGHRLIKSVMHYLSYFINNMVELSKLKKNST